MLRASRLRKRKGAQLEDRHQQSFADLEANKVKTGEGAMQYRYNAQAETSEDGIIVASVRKLASGVSRGATGRWAGL